MPRERAVVKAMTGNAWLWQVKHCFRFSIEPRAPVSKSGSDFTTAALMASFPETRSAAIASKSVPEKAQRSAAGANQRSEREFMGGTLPGCLQKGNTEK